MSQQVNRTEPACLQCRYRFYVVVVREANQLLEFGTCGDYRIRDGKVSALGDFDLSRLRGYVRVNINYFEVSLDSRFSYLRRVGLRLRDLFGIPREW